MQNDYYLVSNSTFLGKICEHVVVAQLQGFWDETDYPRFLLAWLSA